MKTLFTLRSIILILFFAIAISEGRAQAPGDFQTKNTAGNWSESDSWNRYNGTIWLPATSGQIPETNSDVFVQADHIIIVDDATAICDNLYINGSNTSRIFFSAPISTLNIKGDMSLFSTSHNCFVNWAAGAKIVFSGTGSQGFTNLSANAEFVNIEVNKTSGTFSSKENVLSVKDTLFLTTGTFDIGERGTLILDSAILVNVNGNLESTDSSNLTITGFAADTVLLPLVKNISFKNINVAGNRILKMDGVHDINLSGIFTIDSVATYNNGGESQIKGGGSVSISGKFINNDKDNFTGDNGAIPGIDPIIDAGSTIEYALNGDQIVTSSKDYGNLIFSGSGTKTLSSGFDPAGHIIISGSAIVNAKNFDFGGDGANLTMTGTSRLITGGSGTKPDARGKYSLGPGTTIEFNSMNATLESIRLAPTYSNIIISGTGVGTTSLGTPIRMQNGGTFTVKNGGTFKLKNSDGFSGGPNTAVGSNNNPAIILEEGSEIEYNGAEQTITNELPYSNITLSGTGNKTAPSDTLTISGNLSNTGLGDFVHNKGTVLFNNSTSSQIYSSTSPGVTFYNLKDRATGGAGLIINNDISIEGALTLSNSAKLTLDGNITLLSNDTTTASVAEMPASAIISYGEGLFIVERYFTPKRAWRFLSVPTNSQQSIKDAWQEGASSTAENPKPGYGTQITGKFIPDSVNGFDYYSNGPSIKKYDQNDTWIGISSTNVSIASTEGLMTFVRGDRTANNLYSPVSPTVLRTKGQLNTGTQEDITVMPQKFTSIGNPYASALDMRKIFTTNADTTFYVWDPKLGGIGFGGYQTFTLIGDDYYPTPGLGSYGDSTLPYNYIQSGQAFFVHNTTSENGLVSIRESAKASADSSLVNNPFVFRPAEKTPMQLLRTTFYRINANETSDVLDGVLTVFGNDFSNVVDKEDAVKATNFAENLGIKNGNKILSVEKKSPIIETDTIQLNLANVYSGQYKFVIKATNFKPDGLTAYLEDRYAKNLTPIDLSNNAVYTFKVEADSASQNPARFSIVFKAADPLPVTFTLVKAHQQNTNIMVQWNVENEKNIKEYIIEKSLNGQDFSTENTVKAKGNNSISNNYNWLDKNTISGNNYYRIVSVNVSGEKQYSAVVNVLSGNHPQQIFISPAPIVNNVINLQFINQPKGNYTIKLLNISGQVLSSFNKAHQEGSSSETIRTNTLLPGGIYLLHIKGPGKEVTLKFSN